MNLTEIVFGDGEDHGDGLNLRDDGEGETAGGLHDVARIDEAQANSAGDRRDDVAIVDLNLIEAHYALVDFDGALLLEDEFFLIVESLLGNGVAVPGVVITLEVHLGLGEKIGVAFERALGLEKGCLVGAGVDVDQRIAFANELAFFVVDGRDDSIDLAGDRGGVNGRDGADGIEIDADVALLGVCGNETDRAAATSRGFCGGRGGVALAQDKIESAGKYQEHNNPHDRADTLVPGGCIGYLVFRTRG